MSVIALYVAATRGGARGEKCVPSGGTRTEENYAREREARYDGGAGWPAEGGGGCNNFRSTLGSLLGSNRFHRRLTIGGITFMIDLSVAV